MYKKRIKKKKLNFEIIFLQCSNNIIVPPYDTFVNHSQSFCHDKMSLEERSFKDRNPVNQLNCIFLLQQFYHQISTYLEDENCNVTKLARLLK